MAKVKADRFELSPESLRWTCDPKVFSFATTADTKPLEGVFGQKRAIEALELGLGMRSPGFHVFAVGMGGTGKLSTIKKLLAKLPRSPEKPRDILYLNNFRDPKEPMAVKMPAGKGCMLKRSMRQFLVELRESIPNLFDNKEYKVKRDAIVEAVREKQKLLYNELEAEIQKLHFAMVQVQVGPMVRPAILPVIENQPVSFEQLEGMVTNGNFPKEKLEELKKAHQVLTGKMETAMKESRALERSLREGIKKLEQDVAGSLIHSLVDELREAFPEDCLTQYFDAMTAHTLENLSLFKEREESDQATQAMAMMQGGQPSEADVFLDWDVNILVDNCKRDGPAVIYENTPSYKNLFGTVEKTFTRAGTWATDFTKIRAGSILQADGGYIVFNILDAVTEPGVWKALKRTIRSSQVEIESYDAMMFYITSALKPMPIDVDVKFVVVGESYLYYYLYNADEDFKKMFKVRADFDTVMDRNEDAIQKTARFVAQVVQKEKLLPFDRTALAALAEECVSMADEQEKMTTRFSVLADIVRESSYWAKKAKAGAASAKYVQRALDARKTRSNMIEEKIQEMIDKGTILLSTGGSTVGQVNGLAVYQIGEYTFGKPSRITAKVSMGRSGLINIEREAKLSGKTYDKGILILSGFLRGRFSLDKPISLSASIAFEQSYSGVDGDSASSTETYALFSAIANVPLSQSIAVTGSINQHGQIQPIGGVNEKIQGFFDVCSAKKKLTGRQGVVIPIQNVKDLMLSREIVEAVRKKKFHIWAISHVDEGLEILSGIPAGERGKDGKFPKGTFNELVDSHLLKLARDLQDFGKEKKDSDKKAGGKSGKKSPEKPSDTSDSDENNGSEKDRAVRPRVRRPARARGEK